MTYDLLVELISTKRGLSAWGCGGTWLLEMAACSTYVGYAQQGGGESRALGI